MKVSILILIALCLLTNIWADESKRDILNRTWKDLFAFEPREFKTGFHRINEKSIFSRIKSVDELKEFLSEKAPMISDEINFSVRSWNNEEKDSFFTSEITVVIIALCPTSIGGSETSRILMQVNLNKEIVDVYFDQGQSFYSEEQYEDSSKDLLGLIIKETNRLFGAGEAISATQ
ncbi:hypothetical protein MLD52_19810 [Puniceicoccaceae bacterium K14]|nr:hypothetical protein [Puniceicoccaceae bacterium K14]